MIEKFIAPGDKLEMKSVQEVTSSEQEADIKLYKSTVYDVSEDGKIIMVMPMEKAKLVLLPIEGEYEVCFFSHGGMYNANVRVVDRQKINNTYVLITEMITNLHKHQRREYYRFNCIVEMLTKELAKAEEEAFEKQLGYLVSETDMKRGVIVDISGGGLRFISEQKYDTDSLILCSYYLLTNGTKKLYEVVGKVLAVRKLDNRPDTYEHRVQYYNLDVDTREMIIKFIFEEERKERKRERLM